ncbi:MAG: sulfate/molybdate ABC transporter ATP-binding protein [Holosporales bacterium]
MGIEVKSIHKRFGNFVALDNVSLSVNTGELVALLGPSGSGKTTLLRVIAGMEFADQGEVFLNGHAAHDKAAGERNVGFVFQHYALFRHMSVFDNIAFGLTVRPKAQRPAPAEIRARVFKLLEMVHLESLHDRFPHQLSGGQRQRVALARALAVEPKLLLLDEPFGALDAKVRQELRRWLRRLHDEIHLTSVFVTHDQEEAMEVADRVVVMSNGRIEQVGTPADVYHNPTNSFVYDFLGNYNVFKGWQDAGGKVYVADYDICVPSPGEMSKPGFFERLFHPVSERQAAAVPLRLKPLTMPSDGRPVRLYARPHDMQVFKNPPPGDYLSARVMHLNPAGPLVKIDLEGDGGAGLYQAEVAGQQLEHQGVCKGDTVYLQPKVLKAFDV